MLQRIAHVLVFHAWWTEYVTLATGTGTCAYVVVVWICCPPNGRNTTRSNFVHRRLQPSITARHSTVSKSSSDGGISNATTKPIASSHRPFLAMCLTANLVVRTDLSAATSCSATSGTCTKEKRRRTSCCDVVGWCRSPSSEVKRLWRKLRWHRMRMSRSKVWWASKRKVLRPVTASLVAGATWRVKMFSVAWYRPFIFLLLVCP